uniref:General transcription factor IIH subunit 4 n=1 Tax=Globisporangium ultimum (strain ATCC 200006 / CBS 805.95 / DAOM BR144) TaxID=431595 RepID=K3WQJ2_GLOUD
MDAFEFLETLPNATLERLYEDPWACQAVFQALPALAQQFVLRLLSCDAPVHQNVLQQWVQPLPSTGATAASNDSTSPRNSNALVTAKMPPQFDYALQKLVGLRVFVEVAKETFQPHPAFQKQLKYALSNLGGSPWEAGRLRLGKENESFSALDLERYARSRWDSVLHFMVGSTAVKEPPSSVVDILLRTKLMQQSEVDRRTYHITDTGYEFMLKDIHVQMWIFMLEYIKTLDNSGALRQEDILQFLFQISYCQTNEYYAVSDLTKTQQLLLGDFIDFGLLYRKRSSSDRFYTTSLAVNLIFGGSTGQKRSQMNLTSSFAGLRSARVDPRSAPAVDVGSELLIVVETNFKVYAYTNSTLHVAMLSVFVDIVARLPNLAIGFITRESLRSALIHGISAQQIYDFLMKHVHPKMRQNNPIIPENIADQIYLWERERNRVTFHEGVLFDGFNTQDDFERVVKYAKDLSVLTWADRIHFKLTISTAGIDRVKHFIQNNTSGPS